MKRTKKETIELFKVYEDQYLKEAAAFSKIGARNKATAAMAKADAYAMAAFEIEHNME